MLVTRVALLQEKDRDRERRGEGGLDNEINKIIAKLQLSYYQTAT